MTTPNEDALIKRWQQTLAQISQAQTARASTAPEIIPETTEVQQPPSPKVSKSVTLIAVSKTKPVHTIAALAAQGQRHFGENYLQEALEKITALRSDPRAEGIVWHYIGSIQRNKTKDIAEHFDWVQTVERGIIAKRLNDQRPSHLPAINVLIQVNIDHEVRKSGCLPSEVSSLVASIKGYERLRLRGLMILPAKLNNASNNEADNKTDNDAFMRTKALFEQIQDEHADLDAWDTLSMGMSTDMTEAIAAGSTMVRVGTAIFGARD